MTNKKVSKSEVGKDAMGVEHTISDTQSKNLTHTNKDTTTCGGQPVSSGLQGVGVVSDNSPIGDVSDIDAECKETPIDWDHLPKRGYFQKGGRPGPGRGHRKSGNGSNPAGDATEGPGDVLTAVREAISRRGEKFWDDLAKKSPVVLAQTLQALGKQAQEQPVTGEQNITIAPSPCALPHPGDIDEATAHTIRLEQENAELKARLAKATGPARIVEPTDRPTWTCQTCLAVAGIERVHDVNLAICPACGARQDGKPSQRKAGSGRPMVGFAAGGGDRDGWEEAGSIHEAVRRGRT